MPKYSLEIGDVVQIDPDHDKRFGGCFMQITEPKKWGAQGFVAVPGADGVAYYRCPFDAMEFVGRAVWVKDDSEKENRMRSKLEDIGFYSLCDARAENVSACSPMWRCEMILTDRCNFSCPYCRGLKPDLAVDMPLDVAKRTLEIWIADGLRNIRFSGGEPTLYPHLRELVRMCRDSAVQRIAISTNGSREPSVYKDLLEDGVNDFSISLDACCAASGDRMAGTVGCWDQVVANIRYLSQSSYVTVGVVVTDENLDEANRTVAFAHELGVSDIRVVPAAQSESDVRLSIGAEILSAHPILKYRHENMLTGRGVRGMVAEDCRQCHLVKDDSVVAGRWHFPCVIHLRESGKPIGVVGPDMRTERMLWSESHDSFADPICRSNCLDVCIDYNNKAEDAADLALAEARLAEQTGPMETFVPANTKKAKEN